MNAGQSAGYGAPSPAFLATVRQLGEKLRFDTQKLGQGVEVEYKGIVFWIVDYGTLDPDGITVAFKTGTLQPEAPTSSLKELLIRNAVMPAVHGYFGLTPDSDTVIFCIRFDLTRPNAPDAIMALIENMAAELVKSLRVMAEQFSKMTEGSQAAREHAPARP